MPNPRSRDEKHQNLGHVCFPFLEEPVTLIVCLLLASVDTSTSCCNMSLDVSASGLKIASVTVDAPAPSQNHSTYNHVSGGVQVQICSPDGSDLASKARELDRMVCSGPKNIQSLSMFALASKSSKATTSLLQPQNHNALPQMLLCRSAPVSKNLKAGNVSALSPEPPRLD